MAENKKWTNSELLTLGDLYRDGKSYTQIASKLNRSRGSVAHALHVYRDVINIEYRQEGSGNRPKPVTKNENLVTEMVEIKVTPLEKPGFFARIMSLFK